MSTATRLPVGRPPRPTDLADRAAVDRIAVLAKVIMLAARKPGRGVWESERQLKQWLDIQFSTADIAVALNLLEGIGLIQRATVKQNAARPGWLVTAADKAAERGLLVNGNEAVETPVKPSEPDVAADTDIDIRFGICPEPVSD